MNFPSNGSVSIGTTVPQCSAVAGSGSMTPANVTLGSSSGGLRNLTSNHTILVSTAACGERIRVQVTTRPGNVETLELAPNAAGTTWSVSMPPGTFGREWTTGTGRTLTFQRNTSGSNWSNFTPSVTVTFTATS